MRVMTNMLAPKEFESINESGNVLNLDMYEEKEKDYFAPMQTILASLASCAAVDLVEMVKKRRKELMNLNIETIGERSTGTPKVFTKIEMVFTATSPDLKEEEFEKLVELAAGKYCSVAGSLKVKATHKAVVKRPNEA